MSERRDRTSKFEQQWREWLNTDSALNEAQVRKGFLERISDRRFTQRSRVVLVAAAASVLAAFIGIRLARPPSGPDEIRQSMVHETGPNVVLVLREGKSPIYVLTDTTDDDGGKRP